METVVYRISPKPGKLITGTDRHPPERRYDSARHDNRCPAGPGFQGWLASVIIYLPYCQVHLTSPELSQQQDL